MRILVDGRCFQTPHATGVSAYAASILAQLFTAHPDYTYVVWFNGLSEQTVPKWTYPHVQTVWTRYPNKLLHAMLVLFHYPRLDVLVSKKVGGSFDQFLSLNLHAVSLTPGLAHVVTIHDLSFEHLPECYTIWQRIRHALLRPRKQCQQAALIQTPSAYTKQDVVATYQVDESKVVVMPPTVVVPLIPQTQESTQKQPHILCIGTVEPRKNIETLVEAFVASQLYQTHGISLLIVGSSGWKSSLLRKRMKGIPGVVYRGYVSEVEKWQLYRHTHICVYPSLYEGYGLPVAEALSVGTPVITSSRTSLLELYQPGLVHYVDPNNVAEIVTMLQRVCIQAKN